MRLRVIGAVVLLLVGATGVAVAHGNDVSVHSQRSADGSVTVAHVSQITSAHLVLHRDDGAEPGAIVGHTYLPHDGHLTERDLVTVRVGTATWANVSDSIALYAVLHNDDGDGTFEPSEDPMLIREGEPIGHRFTLGQADGNASVVARDQTAATNVSVQRVAIDETGYLVARGHDGTLAGSVPLDAGVHRNVTVPLDPAFYNGRPTTFELEMVLYHDNGDGEFTDADALVTAGSDHVSAHFEVEKAVPSVETPTPESTTPSTPTQTAPSTPTQTAPPTTERPATSTPTEGTTSRNGPGIGPVGTLVAVVVGVVIAVRWQQRRTKK